MRQIYLWQSLAAKLFITISEKIIHFSHASALMTILPDKALRHMDLLFVTKNTMHDGLHF